MSRTTPRQAPEKSDALIVPEKPANSRVTPEESVEGRGAAGGILEQGNTVRSQRREAVLTRLSRVGEKAKGNKEERFNNLLTLLTEPLLEEAYQCLRKDAATGVDAVGWCEYGEELETRLKDLEGRIHRGNYHPLPVRRVHIPKGDGRTRPLGIPALEDKIVQQAVKMILERIYEPVFLGFSYGFRPGRGQHDALDALAVALGRRVSWVLDGDIRSFFDKIDHGWMQKLIEHRISDRRLVRLLMKWLHAGVMEEGKLYEVTEGTPQGGVISPLLANVYLHYVFDLWAQQWRKRHAGGEMYVVRYADDFVMAFQNEQDARAMRDALAERMTQFGLELHPDKTRVIRFGAGAIEEHERDPRARPETFDFLGFTHLVAKDRVGRPAIRRRTSRKKRKGKLAALRKLMRGRMHEPEEDQHSWLCSVLRGHYQYYGVPGNYLALRSFRATLERAWLARLQRRSQRACWNETQKARFRARRPLPKPKIHHPWPERRFALR